MTDGTEPSMRAGTHHASADSAIRSMLAPSSIAIVGATPRSDYGGRFLQAALRARGRVRVYPVNPKYDELRGVACYPSVASLPESPEVVGIVVRNSLVLSVLEESYEKGAKAAVVISAGFAERNDEGRELELALKEFVARTGMRLSGPNSLGVADILHDRYACAMDPRVTGGGLALVCQSGATAFGTLVPRAADLGIGLRAVVSTGNETDLDVCDFAQVFVDDDETTAIAAYVEGFKDPMKFLQLARHAAEREKPIVLMKIGRAPEGARAARSHTASMTGNDSVYQAVFDQYGITRVDDFDELLEVGKLLGSPRRSPRRSVLIVSHSGGICSLMADLCGSSGIEVPALTPTGELALSKVLQGRGSAANPADVSGVGDGERFEAVLETLTEEPVADVLILAVSGSVDRMRLIVDHRDQTKKEIVVLWTGSRLPSDALTMTQVSDVPVFFDATTAVRGLNAAFRYADWLERYKQGLVVHRDDLPKIELPEWILKSGRAELCEHETMRLVEEWGIPTAGEVLVQDAAAALAAATSLGYPVAVKADSPALAHKAAVGAVRLGVSDDDSLLNAFREVQSAARRAAPDAEHHGVLIAKMHSGVAEVIVGITNDPQLGPVLVHGIGGAAVEKSDRIVRRLCPVTRSEADEMTSAILGVAAGHGDQQPNRDAVVELLCRVGDVAACLGDSLQELDLHPILVGGGRSGVVAVDALGVVRVGDITG